MLLFLAICEDPGILSIILLLKDVFKLICLMVPVLLIIMAAIEITKVVLNPDPKVIKSVTSRTIHKAIASVAVFFLPTLVNLLLNLLNENGYKTTDCWINANNEKIEELRQAQRDEGNRS